MTARPGSPINSSEMAGQSGAPHAGATGATGYGCAPPTDVEIAGAVPARAQFGTASSQAAATRFAAGKQRLAVPAADRPNSAVANYGRKVHGQSEKYFHSHKRETRV